MEQANPEYEYVGFWPRVGATLIDTLLLMLITLPLSLAIYGREYFEVEDIVAGPADFLISWVLPAVVVVAFWLKWQATPGKRAISARIVDARTGGVPTGGQYAVRYLGYFVSTIPLCLGLIWVAFDARKQGWHDKMAGTLVIRSPHR
ncbi:RDD family protein [Chitiniphilus eburneus]|nr:RDD family protein [Chitiniphilus eburneus]